MTAPVRAFTEIAHRGQESVAVAFRFWVDVAQVSVKVITIGWRGALDAQRALLSATTRTGNGAGTAAIAPEDTAFVAGAPEDTAITAVAPERPAIAAVVPDDAVVVADDAAVAVVVPDDAVVVADDAAVAAVVPDDAVVVPDDAAVAAVAPEAVVETTVGPYGEGSHAPLADRSEIPDGFPIKGNDGSKLYHVPGSAFYKRTVAEVWFATPAAAEAAGFQLPASQR